MSSAISMPSSQNTNLSVPVSNHAADEAIVTWNDAPSDGAGWKTESSSDQPQVFAEQELLDQLYADYWSL